MPLFSEIGDRVFIRVGSLVAGSVSGRTFVRVQEIAIIVVIIAVIAQFAGVVRVYAPAVDVDDDTAEASESGRFTHAGVPVTFSASVQYPRQLRVNDEGPVNVNVEIDGLPRDHAEPITVELVSAGLNLKAIDAASQDVDRSGRFSYIASAASPGIKMFIVRIKSAHGEGAAATFGNNRIHVIQPPTRSEPQQVHWFDRLIQIASAIGLPALIVLFVTERIRRQQPQSPPTPGKP